MSFDDLFGNERIKNILTSYLRNKVIPYSMIFTGPGSTDLLEFAIAFTKAVNCRDKQDDFCGVCTNCSEIEKEIFLDLKILTPDGQQYKKEQIIFLIEDNYKKPLKGEKKINILTDAHKMNENSANAFLKVLEEPAQDNIFILLTTNMNALLPTIKSRCQVLRFSPQSRAEIKKYLTEQGYDPDKAKLMSYLCRSNLERVLMVDFDEFMEKRAKSLSDLKKLIKGIGVEDILLDLYQKSRSRENFIEYFKRLVNLLSLMLRDIMILKIDENNKNLINIDYRDDLMSLCEYITIDKILFLIRKMELLLRDVRRNLNTKVLILEFIKSYTTKRGT
jgi:DNA polymerase-3 subunit delta'